MNHWEQHCVHCWNRTILTEGPDGTMGCSADVQIVQKSDDWLLRAHPDYLGKWVYLGANRQLGSTT
jgi:hypothetical protein